MTFGEKLQALRKKQGLSQEQLAEMLEVSRQAVSKWELNASMPDVDKIVAISRCFSVSTDYLLKDEMVEKTTGTGIPNRDNSQENDARRHRMVFRGCLGVVVLGMLVSLGANIPVCALELAWCIVFEALLMRENREIRQRQRRRFYTVAVWLLAAPVIRLLLSIWWYARVWQLFAVVIVLIALCAVVSVFCHKTSKA